MNDNLFWFILCLIIVEDRSPRTSSKVGWGDGCGGRVWWADRQLRSWYRAKGAEHNKGAQHPSQYTHYTVEVALLDMRCTVKLRKKLTVVRYGSLRWTGLPLIGSTRADQEWRLVKANISAGQTYQTYQILQGKHIPSDTGIAVILLSRQGQTYMNFILWRTGLVLLFFVSSSYQPIIRL